MKIPRIMVLDKDASDQSEVLNIQLDEDTLIIHALEDVTIALLDGEFPSGTLVFKAGQVIMLPLFSVDKDA